MSCSVTARASSEQVILFIIPACASSHDVMYLKVRRAYLAPPAVTGEAFHPDAPVGFAQVPRFAGLHN